MCLTLCYALPQVEFADVILLNKCDLAREQQLQQVSNSASR